MAPQPVQLRLAVQDSTACSEQTGAKSQYGEGREGHAEDAAQRQGTEDPERETARRQLYDEDVERYGLRVLQGEEQAETGHEQGDRKDEELAQDPDHRFSAPLEVPC